jgi:hypothetical protein
MFDKVVWAEGCQHGLRVGEEVTRKSERERITKFVCELIPQYIDSAVPRTQAMVYHEILSKLVEGINGR